MNEIIGYTDTRKVGADKMNNNFTELYGGISGYRGVSGLPGYSGTSGYSSTSGSSGYSGYSGISGYSGTSGYSSTSGSSGYSGYSGISGYSGTSGYSSTSGYVGVKGYTGYPLPTLVIGSPAGSPNNNPPGPATQYITWTSGTTWGATEYFMPFPACVIRNLRVYNDGNAAISNMQITVRLTHAGSTSDTALTVNAVGGSVVSSDTTHSVTVQAGDLISIKCVPGSNGGYGSTTFAVSFTYGTN